MCAAWGLSGSSPLAAMVTLIRLPVTVTIAVPLPLTPLSATGRRVAIVLPSAACAMPAPRNGSRAAEPRATEAILVVVRIRYLLDSRPLRVALGTTLVPVLRHLERTGWVCVRTFCDEGPHRCWSAPVEAVPTDEQPQAGSRGRHAFCDRAHDLLGEPDGLVHRRQGPERRNVDVAVEDDRSHCAQTHHEGREVRRPAPSRQHPHGSDQSGDRLDPKEGARPDAPGGRRLVARRETEVDHGVHEQRHRDEGAEGERCSGAPCGPGRVAPVGAHFTTSVPVMFAWNEQTNL